MYSAKKTIQKIKSKRKAPNIAMEDELHKWILVRNEKGLRVKDQYISSMALKLKERMRSIDNSMELKTFEASNGWLECFKKQHNLGSQRHTMDQKILENASQFCKVFIQECQELISTHKIKAKSIINMDQVPWYFKTEPKSTINFVLVHTVDAKGWQSLKCFTISFSISREGKHLRPQIINSKRKDKANDPSGVIFDINKTNMWNEKISCNESIFVAWFSNMESLYSLEGTHSISS